MKNSNPSFNNPGVRNECLVSLTFCEGLTALADTMSFYGILTKAPNFKGGYKEAELQVARSKMPDPRFNGVQEAFFSVYLGNGTLGISQGRLTNCAFSAKRQFQFFIDIAEEKMYGVELLTLTSNWNAAVKTGKVTIRNVRDAIGMTSSVSGWNIEYLKSLCTIAVDVPSEVLLPYAKAVNQYIETGK